jgi:hypothetical protein
MSQFIISQKKQHSHKMNKFESQSSKTRKKRESEF